MEFVSANGRKMTINDNRQTKTPDRRIGWREENKTHFPGECVCVCMCVCTHLSKAKGKRYIAKEEERNNPVKEK